MSVRKVFDGADPRPVCFVKNMEGIPTHHSHKFQSLLSLISHQQLNCVIFYISIDERLSYELLLYGEELVEVEPVGCFKFCLKLHVCHF